MLQRNWNPSLKGRAVLKGTSNTSYRASPQPSQASIPVTGCREAGGPLLEREAVEYTPILSL